MEHQLVPFECLSLPRDAVVLVLAPHPDDEVFGCGGTIALHTAQGGEAHVVLLTAGGAGGDPGTRLAESAAAAEILGLPPPVCWHLDDREVRYGERLVEQIVEAVSRFGATVLLAPSLWEVHPDHRATALAAIEASRRHGACDLMAYEVGAPLRPNRLVDITPVLDAKRRAVACFASQFGRQRYDLQMEGLNRYRTYTLPSHVQAAEAFEYLPAGRIDEGALEFFHSEYQRQRNAGLILTPAEMPLVSVAVRCADGASRLSDTLDSIAVQTWGRIEVVVAVGSAEAPQPHLPPWCGRFPMRLVDLGAATAAPSQPIKGELVLFLDAGDAIPANAVDEAVRALTKSPSSATAVLLYRSQQDDGPPDEAAADPLRQWRHELRLLLDPNRAPLALFRRGLLDAALTARALGGSRASDRAIGLELFARGALSSAEVRWIPVSRGDSASPAREAELSGAALAAFLSAMTDPASRRVIEGIHDGLAVPWMLAILDANHIDGRTLLDRIRVAAQQAAQRNAVVDLLDRHRVPGLDVEDRVRRAVQAYQEMGSAQRLLADQPNLAGNGWEDRLRQACDASGQLPGLQRELAAMRQSHSWTFTAPLRYLGALLRRARAG